ncbi:hypothetical protein [Chryseosolibacter indicus]|uniref:C4-dicarboxylate ABC transporter n=1 Tax=Chryseosolibacter indicus TaxID=2782351 RepID=A0ABS5VU46_9BACT|nr:hypothetical protein [Chryseosolibacter indicus]MBT1704942.1 hypothetical protein [Chryseosolibacter indicus]
MEENNEERKLSASDLIAKSFGAIMVVLYVVIGTTIIFKAQEIRNVPETYAKVIGTLLILYGLYRGYKLYRKYFSNPE